MRYLLFMIDEYKRARFNKRIEKALRKAERQHIEGDTHSHEEVMSELRKFIKEHNKER